MKVKLFKPIQEEALQRAGTKDSVRNALGFIPVNDIQNFLISFIKACENAGLHAKVSSRYYGTHEQYFLQIENKDLLEKLNGLSKKTIPEISLFWEPPVNGHDERGFSIEDKDRLMIWINYHIAGKALTEFRKFLNEHIIKYIN